MRHSLSVLIFVVLSFGFTVGVSFGYYKYPPFYLIYNYLKFVAIQSDPHTNKDSHKFSTCKLQIVSEVIENSHAFIGHAYGSPVDTKPSDYIAPNALKFIAESKQKLKSITFTGDVFDKPSLSKWQRLSQELNSNQKIFIAPGNHDIKRPASRDVFDLSIFGQIDYPFTRYLDDFPVVYDDSESSNWGVSDETLRSINKLSSEIVVIARHNVPTSNLLGFSNSGLPKSSGLKNVEDFVLNFSNNISYVWVVGDSGAYERLPRLTCLKYMNHMFLINGLGEVLGDSVLLFKNGKFYQYVI